MLEWLWPSVCLGCDRTGQGWLCPRCRPARLRVDTDTPEGVRRIVWLAPYGDPLGRVIRRGKYTPDRWVVSQAGDVLARTTAAIVRIRGGALVPAPSTWMSRFKRGFAPASVLASRVGRASGVPVRPALTLRAGRRQATGDRLERLDNLRGRVRCETPLAGHVWLVDDVMTTGATASACARELLGAGASEVSLLVLCRVDAPE